MRVIHKNIKVGEIKIFVENLDDLWYLSQIIEENDILMGSTTRKIVHGDSSERSKVERKRIFLSIIVEKSDFSDINILRILGKVNSDNEDVGKGNYHSFEIEQGTEITIIKKEWPVYQLKIIDDAVKTNKSKILICILDRESVVFAKMKKEGFEVLSDIKGEVQKKEERNVSSKDFYLEVWKKMEDYDKRENYDSIIVASPAFFKDDFIKSFNSDIKKKITLSGCFNTGKSGIVEVLKRDEIVKAIKEDKAAKEINLVEKLLSEVAKNGKATYGLKNVKDAVDSGAVEVLMITDSFINKKRQEKDFNLIDKIMKDAENLKAELNIISSLHDGGKKLDGLGGIAVLLRFKI